MSEQDADRIRDAIQRDQTSCRCGHLLAACADCRDWLSTNIVRIQSDMEWWYIKAVELQQTDIGVTWGVDAAEAEALAYYKSVR